MADFVSSKVAEDTYLIDTVSYGMPRFVGSYVIAADKIAVVDCGPTTSLPHLKAEIKKLGFKIKDIDYLVITHIHIDHFGGVGTLLQELPKAQVIVHQRGAKHIINPTPMLERTRAMVGDAAMERDGAVLPIPAARVRAVQEGETLDLGKGHRLKLIHTPGHSNSALCMLDEKLNGLYVGDSAGVCFVDDDAVLSPAPAGDFDLELSLTSIQRMQGLKPDMLFFPHFGVSRRAALVLKKSESSLRDTADTVLQALKKGPDKVEEALKEKIVKVMADVKDKGPYYQYMMREVAGLSSAGYSRYFARKNQA
ncbi:MAG: MBL fold metallo-hydrolase [Dehalococcoidia bacterium]|nr:MBL fold metallo-hydrolase [Dehalococcoidia bacterium]